MTEIIKDNILPSMMLAAEEGDIKINNIKAAMILSATADAMGYKNGTWEFEKSPKKIIDEYEALGGYQKIEINKKDWRLSDDTIMHLATAEAITKPKLKSNDEICEEIGKSYIECMKDMEGRAPGIQTITSTEKMVSIQYGPGFRSKARKWNETPYNKGGGGCGGSMRSMCIGFRYCKDEQLDKLIAISIESGRITHNHPVGFLGAMVSALFASYAIKSIPPKEWATKLMIEIKPLSDKYLKETSNDSNRNVDQYKEGCDYFWNAWESYLKKRNIPTTIEELKKSNKNEYPIFPENYTDYQIREEFYHSISFSGWGGSSGHDSVIISYDALLGSADNWEEMIKRSILHGGDNDSTGAIGCCWFGALYGFNGVPDCNWKSIEYKSKIEDLSNQLIKSIN